MKILQLDEGYFNIAKKRIEEAQAQSRFETCFKQAEITLDEI